MMRKFTSTFTQALIIFGAFTAEVVLGHVVNGRFKAEEIHCVPRHMVSNASKCLSVLSDVKNADWRLA